MIHDPEGRISLRRNPERVRIKVGNAVIADTRKAMELREIGYPARQYIPRGDVTMEFLIPSETMTHCPFKGDASYYSIRLHGDTLRDAVWSYERPLRAMSLIAGHLAFDVRFVEEIMGPMAGN